MVSELHRNCTAPHRTSVRTRMRHEMHLCTLSFHFLARFARVLVLTAGMDVLLQRLLLCRAAGGNLRLGALGTCAIFAQGSR